MLCRIYCKVVGVASYVIPTNWCLLEYMNLVKTIIIIARCSLYTYYNLVFRHYVPIFYSFVLKMEI